MQNALSFMEVDRRESGNPLSPIREEDTPISANNKNKLNGDK